MPSEPVPVNGPIRRVAPALRAPGGQILVLRAFLGVTFTFAGLQKLANRAFFEASSPASLQFQLAGATPGSPIRPLLRLVAHAPVEFGIAIAVGEIAVGIGTLLGLEARLASAGGLLLSLSFFLSISWATSPYYYGSDIVFVFAWTVIVIGGAGPLSLDAARAERAAAGAPHSQSPAISRRRVLAATGAATAALAGLDALIGRVLTPASSATTPTSTTSPANTGATTATTSAAPSGRRILAASQVPVGGAQLFTDPYQEIPAYALQPEAGRFVAFSAICTHLGCQVNFVESVERFICPCHGSQYDADTGAVLNGPAPRPLSSIAIHAANGDLYVRD